MAATHSVVSMELKKLAADLKNLPGVPLPPRLDVSSVDSSASIQDTRMTQILLSISVFLNLSMKSSHGLPAGAFQVSGQAVLYEA